MSDASLFQAEFDRLADDATRKRFWKRWGPYLAERQWGTVREDYSPDGNVWGYFTHDHARSRAYRWGEDGLLGFTDRQCRLCFAVALWNGKDPILKERFFGLNGHEGNHGEDVKEFYFYTDSSPTHSYCSAVYKYPQAEYPYQRLIDENRARSREEPEFNIEDSGVFDESRYFDVKIEYAKDSPNSMLIRVVATNRGPDPAPIWLIPQLWFRNTWAWGPTSDGDPVRPTLRGEGSDQVVADHPELGMYRWVIEGPSEPRMMFTENDTNMRRVFGVSDAGGYAKDAFHEHVVSGRADVINPERVGTKAGAMFQRVLAAGESVTIKMRLFDESERTPTPGLGEDFESTFARRIAECDAYYASRVWQGQTPEDALVVRQAYAGLFWSKQYYHYVVADWLKGDPLQPPPDPRRASGRNSDWSHLFNRDIISMPDTWEYPWYAAWDLAFHCVAFARVDPHFAKDQLLLLLREWYMHPSGQIPAYEFALGDVNPPVHAWACWRVYKLTGPKGGRDRLFLERAFQKLLMNFTWWVNRKDPHGKHLFSGGFLGLDNIGVFDRSAPLPGGVVLEQADATAWMAFFCTTMLAIATELAKENPAYEDIASKFFEHFVAITDAMNTLGGDGLWDEKDGFYYDQLRRDDETLPLRVRSLVGIIPILAVEVLSDRELDRLPGFRARTAWFLKHRPDLAQHVACMEASDGESVLRLLAIPSRDRLKRVLRYLLDEEEFLSPFGIRSMSRVHKENPYVFDRGEHHLTVAYVPGESSTSMFGGNSNWRGPVWFPLNYLIIESLERYHYFYGETLKVEFPTGSGRVCDLREVADHLRARMISLFLPDKSGKRPCHGDDERFRSDPHWKDLLLYHEYFHAETGKGLGANHQTGWTALVAQMYQDLAKKLAKRGSVAAMPGQA
ncbi:MAG: glucosidase [Phycisphaeraceae bacterium]|nr:MAG: glucosidase [Phycisphaeraceae bacterium]